MNFKTLIVCFALIFVTGCTPQKTKDTTLSITHKLGTTEVNENPQNVFVFDMGIIDMMESYDLPISGVPTASLTTTLKSKLDPNLTDIGTLFEPNYERISEAQPDLIVISGRSAKHYEALSKIAPTIYMGRDSHPDGLIASMKANTEILHQLYPGRDLEGLMTDLESQVDAFKNEAQKQTGTLLFLMANGNEIKAFGPESRYDHVYRDFGFTPVSKQFDVSTHGSTLSFEQIQDLNPDYILVMDRSRVTGGEGNAEVLMDNAFVKATRAYQNGHIIYVDPEVWYLTEGGTTAVLSMIESLKPLLP